MALGVQVNGNRIRTARLAAGLTQAQLARKIETPERNIIRWENGQNEPRVAAVAAIAEATGRDLDFFLTEPGSDDDEEESSGMPLTRDEFTLLGDLMGRLGATISIGVKPEAETRR